MTSAPAQLATVWKDPDFDPRNARLLLRARAGDPDAAPFHHDAVALGIDPAQTKAPLTLQERAWSSPIWYTPSGAAN